MKKFFVWGAALCMVFALGSCKSGESAYKKAYEQAKLRETMQGEANPAQQNTPVEVTPVTPVRPTQPVDVSNVPVRTENLTVISGSGLKKYSVVCGSFGVKANAERLQQVLSGSGYAAQIALNPSNNMYRVIAATYDDKATAVQARDGLRSKYPDAWLLYTQK